MNKQLIKQNLTLFRALILSQALSEVLDDLTGTVVFRQQVKHHAKNLNLELLKVINDPINLLFSRDEEIMFDISKAIDVITESFVKDSPAILVSIPDAIEQLRRQFNEQIGDEVEYIQQHPITQDEQG